MLTSGSWTGGGAARTSTPASPSSLPAELRTNSKIVFTPVVLKLVEYDEPLPEPPPLSLQAYVSIGPPLLLTVQVMLSFTTADDGQLTLISGGSRTSTVAEALSLPAELRAVSEIVFAPAVVKLVEYDELLPEPPSLSLQA